MLLLTNSGERIKAKGKCTPHLAYPANVRKPMKRVNPDQTPERPTMDGA